ncbi:snoRNP complex protein nop56, partial [Dissophora globulifera]
MLPAQSPLSIDITLITIYISVTIADLALYDGKNVQNTIMETNVDERQEPQSDYLFLPMLSMTDCIRCLQGTWKEAFLTVLRLGGKKIKEEGLRVNYFLYESSSGYALFERLESEEIGSKLADVCAAATDITKFGKMVKLKSFAPFKSAAHALENMNDVSEGIMNDHLKAFLEMNLPKPGKKSKVVLGVTEKSLAGSIKDGLGVECDAGEIVLDL